MKNTGVVRKLDEFGRLVLPSELRKELGIDSGTPVEFFVENENVIIKRYAPSCTFCDETEKVTHYMGKLVCFNCIKQLYSRLNT